MSFQLSLVFYPQDISYRHYWKSLNLCVYLILILSWSDTHSGSNIFLSYLANLKLVCCFPEECFNRTCHLPEILVTERGMRRCGYAHHKGQKETVKNNLRKSYDYLLLIVCQVSSNQKLSSPIMTPFMRAPGMYILAWSILQSNRD